MGYTTFSYVAGTVASPQQLLQQRAHQQAARRQDQALRVPSLRTSVRARAVVRQLLVLHHLVRMIRILLVLLLLTGRGLGRRDRGRRSIVNRLLRLMRMRGVDGRRGHMGQGRRRRARLMMIVMMMNAAPRVESISAPVDDRRQRGRQAGGGTAQNRGTCRAAAGHGAAGYDYGVVARCRRRGGGLGLVSAADLEDDLHVVAGAPSADAPVKIVLGRGADEVVIVAREELEAPGLRRERPERDGEVHRFARLVAHRYHPRTRVRYPTCLVLLLGHVVDDVLLSIVIDVRVRRIYGTYYIDLIVLEHRVVFVHVNYVICVVYSKYGIRGVPVHADRLRAVAHSRQEYRLQAHEEHQSDEGRGNHGNNGGGRRAGT